MAKNKIKGGSIPKEFIPAIEKGVIEALEGGILAGYPMVDVKVSVLDGAHHEVDSSEMAFKICASICVKDACRKAKSVLLEPVMAVEVVVPEEYMGPVNGDLVSRRGRLEGTSIQGTTQIIKASVPLSEMFGYATDLRSPPRKAVAVSPCTSPGTKKCRMPNGRLFRDPGKSNKVEQA